jgi:hypothetical protein
MNTSNKSATSIFRAGGALNVSAVGSSETLVSNPTNYTASHRSGQIFIAKEKCKSQFMFEFSVEMQGLKFLPKP